LTRNNKVDMAGSLRPPCITDDGEAAARAGRAMASRPVDRQGREKVTLITGAAPGQGRAHAFGVGRAGQSVRLDSELVAQFAAGRGFSGTFDGVAEIY